MPEISDQELNNLRASDKLLRDMLEPDTKREFERLLKKKNPKIRTTDDDVVEEREMLKKLEERFDKIEERFKKEADDEADQKFFEALADLKANHGLTDEGEVKLKQVMKEKIIPDPYVAFDHMRAHEPKPQPPSSFAPMSWGFGAKTDDKDIKSLFEDPDGWAEREARSAWNDAQQR